MNIVQFIITLGQGGAEAVVKDYALELKKRGHNVQVVVLFPFVNSNNEKILLENGITIRSIFEEIYISKSMCFPLRVLRKPFKEIKVSNWFKKYIKEFKPDVIHVHLTLLNYFTRIKEELNNVKLFFTCHNEVEYYFGEEYKKDKEDVDFLVKRNNLHLIGLHENMAAELEKKFPSAAVTCLYNPVNLGRFINPTTTREEMRKSLNIPEDAFVLGHNGRFVAQKNHKYLVKVFDKVKKQNKNAFLLMIGNGDLRSGIESELNNMGYKDSYLILENRRDVPDLLNAMDVFVFPSLFEGLGIALVEAEAAGLRCVVSDKVPELAFTGNNTFPLNIEENNLDKWCSTILSKEKNKTTYGDISNFDISTIINKLEELYKG